MLHILQLCKLYIYTIQCEPYPIKITLKKLIQLIGLLVDRLEMLIKNLKYSELGFDWFGWETTVLTHLDAPQSETVYGLIKVTENLSTY
jgi:hypothetical protein